jgi:hypothetical protein
LKVPACKGLADTYIKKIAQKYRSEVIRMFEVRSPYVEIWGARMPDPTEVAELKRYLARKSARA